jgi:hypothetical protein
MKLNFIKNLLLLRNSDNLLKFIAHNKKVFPNKNKNHLKGSPVVLFELNNMQSAHIAYSYLANVLTNIHDAKILAYLPQSRISKWNEFTLNIKKLFLSYH